MSVDNELRRLPSVDRLLAVETLGPTIDAYSHETVVTIARDVLSAARRRIADGGATPSMSDIANDIAQVAQSRYEPTLRPVINATGVLIHTNLGRSPLSKEAVEAARLVSLGYTNLEIDLEIGTRGSRHDHLELLLCELTGAEAGMAVNNNAAAVTLALTTLGKGREVIVSRGEAVEIGGGFRLPDIIQESGATLVEVGTTNRTYIDDYERAVTEETAALLRIHTSNYQVTGFTHAPTLEEMAAATARHRLPLLHDVGSGCLLETRDFGMAHEPTPQESIAGGADLVLFSGDKLLGGPQAGIIVGKDRYLQQLKAHPLTRALRIDKGTLASLQITLLHYARGEATDKLPLWRMVSTPIKVLDRRARRWARAVGEGARVVDGLSTIGGGSLPGQHMPTRVLSIEGSGQMLQEMSRRLRTASPPIVGRIERDHLILDPRTVAPSEDRHVLAALTQVMTNR